MKQVAREAGLTVEFERQFEEFQEKRVRSKFLVADIAFRVVNALIAAVSLGR